MIFKETHKTKDNLFYVELPKNLDFNLLEKEYGHVSNNRTNLKIKVYNKKTYRLSEKSLYVDKNNRLYFKGVSHYYITYVNGQYKYYIDELIEVEKNANL